MSLYTEHALTNLKQARDATDKARQTVKDAKRTTEELEAKLQRLKQEHDDCRAALRVARSTEEDAYTKYAQTVSRSFTTAFLTALPRELRDHVYSYLWDDEDIVRQTKRSVREYAWSYRMPEFCAPPYVQPDHVGDVVAGELALSIYKKAFKTSLHVTVSAGHVHKFLVANPLRSNLKPADCIRALDIEWYPNEYSDKDVARSFQELSNYNFPEPIPVKLILGKVLGGNGGNPETPAGPAEGLGVFQPAYDALMRRHCPVTIERLC
ncbi:hypothetical protein EKO04_006158 [Ascochyta lentis]|uniref:Uncharacterized protein n=1 Tax=Ascochyta lentis TaxID=205686 RepID=A0A8H7MID6_9PLEO|nr:hypothetical protein EKO04_006158 [Ascochyta lentis]